MPRPLSEQERAAYQASWSARSPKPTGPDAQAAFDDGWLAHREFFVHEVEGLRGANVEAAGAASVCDSPEKLEQLVTRLLALGENDDAALQSSAVEQPREDETNREETRMDQPMAGSTRPRDEVEINRKKARAITVTDDFLRALLTGNEHSLPEPLRGRARACRALLAEWRQESE
jgi:hypothetical protein